MGAVYVASCRSFQANSPFCFRGVRVRALFSALRPPCAKLSMQKGRSSLQDADIS